LLGKIFLRRVQGVTRRDSLKGGEAQVCGGDVLVLLFLKRIKKRHHHHPTDVGEHLLDVGSCVLVASAALTLHEELDQHLLFDNPM
jgi:hypothetical protein